VLLAAALLSNNLWPDSNPGVNLQLTTHLGDRQTFRGGDRIGFMLSLDRSAYVSLFYVDAEKHVTRLLPNPQQPDYFFEAGLFQPFPNPQAGFEFHVQPPFGTEFVWAFASDRPLVNPQLSVEKNELPVTPQHIDDIRAGIRAESQTLFDQASVEFYTEPVR
jgi:hypothetical protein